MKTHIGYLGIVQVLGEEIDSLPPNSLIDTEQCLAKRFGVSRVTVRRALGIIERSGRISRQRGQGTVVSPPKVKRQVIPVCTIEQDLREQGLELETRVLSYEPCCDPPEQIQLRLSLEKGEAAGYLRLVRLVRGRIISFDQRFLCPAIATQFDPSHAEKQAVSHILEDLTGSYVIEQEWEMQIIPSQAEIAKVLGIVPGVLTLVNTFTEYVAPHVPVQAGTVSYRIDRVKFEFVARGQVLNLSKV